MSTPCKCFIPSWPTKFYCQWIGSVFISGHRINIFPWFIMKSEVSCKSALLVNQVVEFTVFSQLASFFSCFLFSFLKLSTSNTNYFRHSRSKTRWAVLFLYCEENLQKVAKRLYLVPKVFSFCFPIWQRQERRPWGRRGCKTALWELEILLFFNSATAANLIAWTR